ncbi:MAG: DUF302 domain-containing protein [Bacteroidota bacterium]
MKFILLASLCVVLQNVTAQNLTVYRSESSVDSTVDVIVRIINSKDLVYFETVAHDEIAAERGIELNPTRMILFEDPDLMVDVISCRQTTALDLPMKILVWEEEEDVYVGFFDPKVMLKRFMLQGCEDVINQMSRLKIRIVNEALRQL